MQSHSNAAGIFFSFLNSLICVPLVKLTSFYSLQYQVKATLAYCIYFLLFYVSHLWKPSGLTVGTEIK